jgi:hypothetical protein
VERTMLATLAKACLIFLTGHILFFIVALILAA